LRNFKGTNRDTNGGFYMSDMTPSTKYNDAHQMLRIVKPSHRADGVVRFVSEMFDHAIRRVVGLRAILSLPQA